MEELPTGPQGLRMQADFISASHEAELLHIFQHELTWPEAKSSSSRLSLHYGYTFDYKTFGVDPAIPYKPFPAWLRPLIPQLAEQDRDPDQVCLQYYPPGAGIPPHVDTHSAFDQLYALSLGSAVVMRFRRARPRKGGQGEGDGDGDGGREIEAQQPNGKDRGEVEAEREFVDVDLPPRSMMEMSGDSRLHWEHGIRKRKKDILADGTVRMRGDRWSITYRWLREGGVCECGNEKLCDTAQRRIGVEREYRWKQQQNQTGEQQNEVDETALEAHQTVQVAGNGESNGASIESPEIDKYHKKDNIPLSPP
ncbi:hypothetical protein F5Y10DRAFT_240043 [Nemania abortiva]|nr:hypothetical protein F5Y10DRAFT_240043 [Nemania abortiva]